MNDLFAVKHALLCEDIREEKNGKHTLVGVYPGDIEISAIPGNMAVALYVETVVLRGGNLALSLRFSGPGEHAALLKAAFVVSDSMKFAVLATPRIDLLVDQEGTFRIEMSTDDQEWTTLVEKQIALNPLIANASQLPSAQSPSAAPASSSQPAPSRPSSPKRRRRS